MTQEELRQLIIDTVYTNTEGEIEGDPVQSVLLQMVGNSGSNAIVFSSQVSAPIPIFGTSAAGAFVNGSDTVTGNASTLYTEATEANGLDTNGRAYVLDGADWYELSIGSVNNAQATIYDHWNLSTDPEKAVSLGANWTGTSATLTMYAFANVVPSGMETSSILGYGNVISGASGNNTLISGQNNVVSGGPTGSIKTIGNNNVMKNGAAYDLVGAENCTAEGQTPHIVASSSCATGATTDNCGILFSAGAEVQSGTNVHAIGLKAGNIVNIPALQDVVVLKNLMVFDAVPDHADNAAALLAGLVVGQIYRTTDVLKIVH